jgi:hypothetical protein
MALSSTDFQVRFDSNFPEIHYAELNWAVIPFSIFPIPSNNNVVWFNENSTVKSAIMILWLLFWKFFGYSFAALNSASGGYNTYSCVYSSTSYSR